MTNKFISMMDGIRQGIASVLTPRCHRSDSLSIVSRQSLLPIFLLCLTLFIGAGQMWGAVTSPITLTTNSSTVGSSGQYTNKFDYKLTFTNVTAGGNNFVQNAKSSSIYNTVTIPGSITSIKLTDCATTSSKTDGGFTVYGGTTQANCTTEVASVSGLSSTAADKTVDFSGNYTFFKITVNSARVLKISSIVISFATGGGSTPSVTPTPTSLDWGTVLQGSSQSTKTISISGSNLTAGSLTISATGGYSVTPTSKGVSGTLSATTLTVTPPSTATAGTKNGKVTISGGGLASSVEVNLSMTVQASHTVTWMVNGSEYATTVVANGGNPVFPSSPTSCDADKVFVGWTETNIGSTETNTAPSFITTATTISSAKTYYAVFAKRGAFTRVTSPSSLALGQELVIVSNKYNTAITTGIGYTAAPTESSSKVTPSEAMIWLLTGNSSDGWRISKPSNGYVLGASSSPSSNNSTTATLTSNNTYSTWGIGQNSYTSNVLYISYKTTVSCALEASSASSNWVVYNSSSYSSNQYCALRVYASSLTKYVTECCQPLGSINGSVIVNQTPTSVQLSWNAVEGAEKYQVKVPGSTSHKDWTDATSGVTVTGLACGTAHTAYFRAIDTNGSHCAEGPESTLAIPAQSWTVTSSGVTNATASPAIPAITCDGFSTTITAATGYALPAEITVSGAESSWNSSTGALTISNVTGDVSVTIASTCVPPVIGTQPASASYQEGATPSADLSVSATLSSGTLTYLWKVSTDGGTNWSNASGVNNAATYAASNISTAYSANGTKYKCIVGNQEGGCSAESEVATITITQAANFVNGNTVFIQAESNSAWDANACVKAWFNNNGADGAAQTTYWLFDATGTDAGKKLFATVVPAEGDLNQVTLQRFAEGCGSHWNDNGTLTKASDGGSNTFRSTGSGTSNVAWNGSGVTMNLMSSDAWLTPVASVTDQGAGVWTGTYEYTPTNTSTEYVIATNYNGNIGNKVDNDHQNENATLNGMIVGSTYNVTATLNVIDHSLVMSKTFVKGEVKFDLQGHGSAIDKLTNVTAGSKIAAPAEPSETGWDFGGWFTDAGCTEGNEWTFATDEVEETMTLYAKWTKQTYTISSTLTNASASPSIPASYEYTGSAAGLSYTITAAEGYRLPENITVTGTTYTWEDGVLTLTGTITGAVSISIEAIRVYTITWSVNSQTSTTNVTDGSPLVLPTPAPTVDGCEDGKTFVGWTATAIVGSTDTKPNDLFTTVGGAPAISSDKTFYAVFATQTPGTSDSEELTSSELTTNITNTTCAYGTEKTYTDNSKIDYAFSCYTDAANRPWVQLKKEDATSYIEIEAPENITKVDLTITSNSNTSGGATDISKHTKLPAGTIVNLNTEKTTGTSKRVAYTAGDGSNTALSLEVSSPANKKLYLQVTGGGCRIWGIKVYYGSSSLESGYITSCTKQVAVTATDGGTATIEGGAVVDWTSFETDLTLVATPDEGYVFAGWSYDDEVVVIDDDNAAQATANSLGSATITANFVAASTINANKDNLNLVVYVDEAEDETETIIFTSSNVPQYGSVIYTIEDEDYDENDTYIVLSPSYTNINSGTSLDQTVTLSFGSDVAGSFSAKLVATSYNMNSVVTATKVIPITLTVKPKFTVTAQADVAAHASAVDADPKTGVKDGQTVTLSQTAADGWVFQKWTISYTIGETPHSDDLVGINTFTMPAANVTATAVYTEKSGTDLTAPTNAAAGSITSHSAVLSWDAVEHTSSYSVYVVGTDFEETFNGITETSYTVTGLKAGITYSWTVTAIGDGVNYYTSSAANGAGFTTTARILSSIAIKTDASKMTYNEGETFDKTGLEVTATYDDETTATISAASLVVPTTPLAAGTTSITVSYTESGVTKEATLEGITITELYVVTWKVNNAPYGDPTYTTGAIGDLPANPSSACSSKYPYFVKWVIGDDPMADAVTPETVIDGSVTVNAVFAKTKTKTGYSSTAATEIVAGGEYIMGAQQLSDNATMWYFSSYSNVDQNVDWGGMSTTIGNAIVLTASGTTSTFQLKDASDNYVAPLTSKKFLMSSTTADLSMTAAGAIKVTYELRHNYNGGNGGLRWYSSPATTGTAVYLYAAEYSYSNLTILCPVTYTAAAANVISNGSVGLKLQAEDDAATSISDLEAGATVLLSATPDDGYAFDAWTVMQGESDITESNVEGNVLTMPAGNVTVSASFNKIAVESVTINGEANVQINNDVVWTLGVTPEEARPTVVWSTANDAVATVNNGTVHGVAVGSTTITATVDGVAYNKTINVIRETKLNSLTVVDPKTAYTLNEAFVAPQVNANYVYVDDESAAPSIEDVAAEFTGFDNLNAGNQTITVSYGNKTTTYNITVSPWTLHLQTKRLYGNDVETPTVVDAEVTTLASPIDLTDYYVAGLCDGYTQLGYITSSEDIDALPAQVLTSYTPSANNETLYGVFQKTNYAGETFVDEDFSSASGSAEIDADDYEWLNTESKVYYDSEMLKLGSKNNSGSLTTNTFDLSHNFVVKLKAKQYASDEKSIQVTVGSTTQSETSLTSSMVEYTFNFNAATSTSHVVITSPKRAYVEKIKIYTLDDIAYTSVYDCREEKDVTYEIGNEQVVWTACENTTVMEGQNYTLCANEPSLQGYDFGGWIINGDEENVKAAGTSIEVATDLTITPKFTEHVYDYSYALDATATNGTIASVTVNGVVKDLAEVALHDGDAVVVTATPNTNYEISEWTHSENVSLTTDANTASFTVAVGAGDMTIAAIFVEKAQYTMTLNVFGRTYTTKQGHEGDSYSSVLAGAASPAISGYDFQGWSTDAENVNAIISGEELLTADVTLYAIVGSLQPTGYVYNKVTSMEDVTADGYYLIVNETANKAFDGSRNSSSDLNALNNYVNVTVSENKIISNAAIDAAVVTILSVPETDPQKHYIKTATGYYIGNGGSTGLLANKTTDYRNTLSFSEGNFVVVPQGYDMVLMFNANAGNGKFGYYGGTQNPIQLYKRGDVHQEIIPEAEPVIEISTEVSASTSFPGGYIGDVTVVNGGSLDADIDLSVGNLIIHSTLGKGTGTNTSGNAPGNCGQVINGNNITVNGDVYLELELTQDDKASAGWYAFSVPFKVDAMNGVYYGDTKLTNEVGYAIMSHYGELRAKDEYAWKKFRGIMKPGEFYVITVGNTDYKTLRFKKVKDEALVASTSVAVSPFPTQTGNNADGAWNGIGNPNLAISNLFTSVPVMQFYDHKTNTFIGRNHSVNLVVGSAFFIQYNTTTSVSIPVGTTDYEGVLAPRREQKAVEEMIYEVQLTNVATGELEDNVFLTAREDATNEYEIGRDVAKLSMGTAKCAQMWIPAYGTNLCAADFQLVNDKATYPLTINAPSAGTYTISTVAQDNADLYLTQEGAIIWNLSMGAYTIDLTKGVNTGYGLLLKAKAPGSATGIENGGMLNGANGVQKVIIDDHVYILRGGQMYDVTGKAVK